jgi:hypothetical protein
MGGNRRAGTTLKDAGHNRILRNSGVSANPMPQMWLRKA